MKNDIVVLCVGDVIGEPGCAVFAKHLTRIKKEYQVDLVILNGENSAKNGRGITPELMAFFREQGAHVVTSGNHVWAKQQIIAYFEQHNDLLRPANYSSECPGKGITLLSVAGVTVGVLNLQGRVFLKEHLDCPFRTAQSVLSYFKAHTNIVIVDFHAEATAEKQGLALYLDGQVSAVVGTHTHVQTADERILPGGTAFISDIGMVGALNAMIGFKKESALRGMLTQMPFKFEVEYAAPFVFGAVVIHVNPDSGVATAIKRIFIVDNYLQVAK